MAKKIKFPLEMKDGFRVRTLEELQEHFDIGKALEYVLNGKMLTWLEDRYYTKEAEKISALDDLYADETKGLLCEILGVEVNEDVDRVDASEIDFQSKRRTKLKQYTDDEEILEKADCTAVDNEDLVFLLQKGVKKVYLFGKTFLIDGRNDNIEYEGVNYPTIEIKDCDYGAVKYENFFNVSFGYIYRIIEEKRLLGYHQEAFAIIKEMADAGNQIAMLHLVDYYTNGYNFVQIDKKMQDLYCDNIKRSKHIGYAHDCCQCIIGNYSSIGMLSDLEEKHLQEEAINGSFFAQFILGVLSSNHNEGEWMRKAAESGYALAEYHLGKLLYSSSYDISNGRKKIELYRKSAEQGCACAQDALGWCYRNGVDVEKNQKKAMLWYWKAAEQGYLDSQRYLGECYYYGNGVEKNRNKAAYWYKKAADQGDILSKEQLEKLGI